MAEFIENVSPAELPTAANDDLSASLAVREAHHRMANTLALLAASLRQNLSGVEDAQARSVLRDHERRIVEFGNLHRQFARYIGSDAIEVESYIGPLSKSLADAILAPAGISCEAFIAGGVLPGDMCETVGLVIAELVTNCAKHAYPEGGGGRIRVEVFQTGNLWHCVVADDGAGFRGPVAGTGTRLVNLLARALNGRLDIRSGDSGTTVVMIFPAASAHRGA